MDYSGLNKTFAMPMYKAIKEENQSKLREILKKHVQTLRKYELITNAPVMLLESEDGTLMELFEWKDENASRVAHEHPAIRKIWGEMEGILEFPVLSNLPEANRRFPNFVVLERY